MRHRYLVAYDVSEAKRLRRVFKKLHGFGDPLQYSLFRCDLSEVEKVRMLDTLIREIHHTEDRVVIVNLGPVDGRGAEAFEYLGRQDPVTDDRGPVII